MIIDTVTVSIAQPTLAVVSEATWFVDGEARPGVISVHRYEDDSIEITIKPLAQLPYPIALEVVIDTLDLAHIKSLLEAQDRAAADPAPRYECRTTSERLATIERRQEEDARRLLALETAMRAEHRTMHATFNEMEGRFSALDTRLDALLTTQLGMGEHIERQAQRLAAVETGLAGAFLRNECLSLDIGNRLAALEASHAP